MIQNIKIRENNTLEGAIKTISFGNKNIIIGPKGGGKSTLFDLLANSVNGNILSTTLEALGKYGLALHSITIDNEEIHAGSLNKIKIPKGKIEKSKALLYDQRFDVIYQDDSIKKNLADSSKFDASKMSFAREILETSNDINAFIDKIKNVYDSISRVTLLDNQNINFSNVFKLSDNIKLTSEQIIFDLNYSNQDVKYSADEDVKLLRRELEKYMDSIGFLTLQINSYKTDRKTFISGTYKDILIEECKKIISSLHRIILKNEDEQAKIMMIIKVVSSFGRAYKLTVSDLKKESENDKSNEKILIAFRSNSINHFSKMARSIKDANASFNEFALGKLELNFNNEKDAGNLLKLELQGEVNFSEEQKYDLMKIVLHNAKKVKTHVANWIMSARVKEQKQFDRTKLVNKIAREVKEKIRVTANGQEYETMSLGQKSIYGIKYKFNNSCGKAMFLDQPEDNLDNYTIATEILELVNSKDEQMFIITHNANIGILSKPDKVVVGSFNKNDGDENPLEQYLEGTIRETNEPSQTAHYLEGGMEYITSRLELLKGRD